MHASNTIKRKRKMGIMKCHFKDSVGFKPTSASSISSYIMMRKNVRWGRFPENHILSKASDVNGNILLEAILSENVGVLDEFDEHFKKSIACAELLAMCSVIVQRHKHVILKTAYSAKNLNDPSCQKVMTVKDAHSQVQRDLLSVFPFKLLGSKKNWQTFLPKIKCLMHQGYSGVLLVDTLMKGIKQSDIQWLRTLRYNGQRQRIIAKILRWIVNWALTYISSFWRVAYSSDGLNFFDRRYWKHLEDKTYNEMIEAGKLTISASTAEYPINAVLQFIPKGEGLRPLIVVKSESDFLIQWSVRTFLNCIIRKYAWKYNHRGHLQDVISVLQKLASFKKAGKISKLYFVRVDIDDAFGSINHKKLQPLLKKIFESLIPKHCYIKEHKFRKIGGAGYFQHIIDYQFNDEKCVPPKGFTHISETDRDVGELLTCLEICSNVAVHSHSKDHVMTRGVGQGVKFSAFLSEIYYRDMVETHLSNFGTNPHEYLLRFADDILFITPELNKGRLFLEMTKCGFPDYNCRMNPTKTHTNVDGATCLSLVRYLGAVINFDTLTLSPVLYSHIKGRVKTVRFDKKMQTYKIMKAKNVLLTCGNIWGARNEPWFLDLRVNGKELVLKTVEGSTSFLAQKLVNTESLLNGVPSSKFIMWRILQFCTTYARSCRRTFNTRFPTSGKAVLDSELKLASFRGAWMVFSTYAKWERVSLALLNKMRKLQAIAPNHPNA